MQQRLANPPPIPARPAGKRMLWLVVPSFLAGLLVGSILGTPVPNWNHRNPIDYVAHPTPIKMVNIAPSDRWLLDFDASICGLHGMHTDSNYAMFVLIPRRPLGTAGEPHNCTLILGGYNARNEIKPIVMDMNEVIPTRSRPIVMILDFLGPAPDFGSRPITLQSEKPWMDSLTATTKPGG